MDVLYTADRFRLEPSADAWGMQRVLLDFLEGAWTQPDSGIWEIRGPLRHFTHSKVMAWVAFDRAVRFVEEFGRDGPVERWRALRDEIRGESLSRGGRDAKQAGTPAVAAAEPHARALRRQLG